MYHLIGWSQLLCHKYVLLYNYHY